MERDSRYLWLVVAASTLIMFGGSSTLASFGLLFFDSEIEAQDRVWILNVFYVSWHFSAPIVGLITSFWSHRRVAMIGSLLSVIGFLATSATLEAPRWFFLTFSIFVGAGYGMAVNTTFLLIASHFENQRGLAVGIALLSANLGHVFGPLLFRTMAPKEKFFIRSLIAALAFLSSTFFVTPEFPFRKIGRQNKRKEKKKSKYSNIREEIPLASMMNDIIDPRRNMANRSELSIEEETSNESEHFYLTDHVWDGTEQSDPDKIMTLSSEKPRRMSQYKTVMAAAQLPKIFEEAEHAEKLEKKKTSEKESKTSKALQFDLKSRSALKREYFEKLVEPIVFPPPRQRSPSKVLQLFDSSFQKFQQQSKADLSPQKKKHDEDEKQKKGCSSKSRETAEVHYYKGFEQPRPFTRTLEEEMNSTYKRSQLLGPKLKTMSPPCIATAASFSFEPADEPDPNEGKELPREFDEIEIDQSPPSNSFFKGPFSWMNNLNTKFYFNCKFINMAFWTALTLVAIPNFPAILYSILKNRKDFREENIFLHSLNLIVTVDLISKVFFAYISDFKFFNKRIGFLISTLMLSLVIGGVKYAEGIHPIYCLCAIYGISLALQSVTESLMFLDAFELENFPSAFGIMSGLKALTLLVASPFIPSPIAIYMYDVQFFGWANDTIQPFSCNACDPLDLLGKEGDFESWIQQKELSLLLMAIPGLGCGFFWTLEMICVRVANFDFHEGRAIV